MCVHVQEGGCNAGVMVVSPCMHVRTTANHVTLQGTFTMKQQSNVAVQEWVPGGELFHHLDIEGSFSDGAACFYAANVLLALECLHARGIVYRDLKPENLLLDTQVGMLWVLCVLCVLRVLCCQSVNGAGVPARVGHHVRDLEAVEPAWGLRQGRQGGTLCVLCMLWWNCLTTALCAGVAHLRLLKRLLCCQ